MRVGFTGTRKGMTVSQKAAVRCWVAENCTEIEEAHHGDCIGADDDFDSIVREFCMGYCKVIVHPSNIEMLRAHTEAKEPIDGVPALITIVKNMRPPLLRDCDIVNATDVMIVTPKTRDPHVHSGTWFTYNYAVKIGKPTVLVHPSGIIIAERQVAQVGP